MLTTSEFCVAVHALAYLNRHGQNVSSEALAQNICTNPARVRKVMAKLKSAMLVQTHEGAAGGYCFIKNATEVSLFDVCNAVKADFVSAAWRSGDAEKKCLIASGMKNVIDNLYTDMNDLCKQHLKGITIADVDRIIFKEA